MSTSPQPGKGVPRHILSDLPVSVTFGTGSPAFEASGESLGKCLMLWFERGYAVDGRTGCLRARQQYLTNRAIVDFSELDLSELNPGRLIRDLELVKGFLEEHPGQLLELIRALQEARVEDACRIVETHHLTEEAMVEQGGGAAGAIVLIVALGLTALLALARRSCDSEDDTDDSETDEPVPPPSDASTTVSDASPPSTGGSDASTGGSDASTGGSDAGTRPGYKSWKERNDDDLVKILDSIE